MNNFMSFKKNIAIAVLALSSIGIVNNTFPMKKKKKCNAKKVKEAYFEEKDPVSYNKGTSFQKFLRWTDEKQRITEQILKVLGDNEELVLDIGAGNGKLTELLESKFEHIVAVEPSPELFKELCEKFSSNKKFTLFNSTFEKLNVNLDKKFDVILASHSFQYIQNPMQAISRIKKLLKETGIFLVVTLRPSGSFRDFVNKYNEDILGEKPADPSGFDYDIKKLLESEFKVEPVFFNAKLTIPSVGDTISLLDFFYNIDFNKIKKETIIKIKKDLTKTYGNKIVDFDFGQGMYICRK